MKQMGFYFDQTRCTGCYACLVACKDWHDIQDSTVNWLRVLTIEKGKFPQPFVAHLFSPCYHCADPPCIPACPAGAIAKMESDGIVIVDQNRCLGRRGCPASCLSACLWKVPQFGTEENARMQKCDFCFERLMSGGKPICVEACPMYALDAGSLDELRARYKDAMELEGFACSQCFKPSFLLKPKKQN